MKFYTILLSSVLWANFLSAQSWKEVALARTNNSGTNYGKGVAIDGQYAVVAEDWEQDRRGAVYIYYFDGDEWVKQAKLTASTRLSGDTFGRSVDIDDNVVIVGAAGYGAGGDGTVYVFEKPELGWKDMTQTATLTTSSPFYSDRFGKSVAISGNTIVVGSYDPTRSNPIDPGTAYLFEKPTGGWANMTETAKLTASDGRNGDAFGVSVAISGNTVVVGAPDNTDEVSSGASYVFEKYPSGWTSMTETAKLTPSDGTDGDHFGNSVDIWHHTVVVGAYNHSAETKNGAVYVYEKTGPSWEGDKEAAKLTAASPRKFSEFGISVSIDANTVVVGASRENERNRTVDSGAAFIFAKDSTIEWSETEESFRIIASDRKAYGHFGYSIDISNNSIIVGRLARSNGSAYIFHKNFAPKAVLEIDDLKGTAGLPFDYQLPEETFIDTENDTLTYSASLIDGSILPNWLNFNPTNRAFFGTPDNVDADSLLVKVDVSDPGSTTSVTFWLIIEVNQAPIAAKSLDNQLVYADSLFNYTISKDVFSDTDNDSLFYSASLANGDPLPTWITFDAQNRSFSGLPTDGDTAIYTVRVNVTDQGSYVYSTFMIEVKANIQIRPEEEPSEEEELPEVENDEEDKDKEEYVVTSTEPIPRIPIRFFPNPTFNQQVVVELDEPWAEIYFFNQQGKKVLYLSNIRANRIVDLSALRSGVYQLTIITNQGYYTDRLLKY